MAVVFNGERQHIHAGYAVFHLWFSCQFSSALASDISTSAVSLTHLFRTVFSTGQFSRQPAHCLVCESELGLTAPSQEN